MSEEGHYYITARAKGGPIDGGQIQFAQPPLDETGSELRNVVRGASFLIVVDETPHEYRLRSSSEYPFQEFEYRGPTVQIPPDIVDR